MVKLSSVTCYELTTSAIGLILIGSIQNVILQQKLYLSYFGRGSVVTGISILRQEIVIVIAQTISNVQRESHYQGTLIESTASCYNHTNII